MLNFSFYLIAVSFIFISEAKAINCTEYNIHGSGVLTLASDDSAKGCVLDQKNTLLFDAVLADYKIFEPATETIGCISNNSKKSINKLVIEQFHWKIDHPVRRITIFGSKKELAEVHSVLSSIDTEPVFVSKSCQGARASKVFKIDEIVVERKPKGLVPIQ